jgi:hypothetical protein
MTREQAKHWLEIELKTWEYECKSKHPIKEALSVAIKALEQEPRKGRWINKHHADEDGLDESCSAECSSCHKRSRGYAREMGYGLKFMYYDFCPNCGSDNREVKE